MLDFSIGDERVRGTLRLLEQTDLRQPVRISQIAEAVQLSTSRLRHVFKQNTGVSLRSHVKMLRLRKARHLVETTEQPIKDIALIVGLPDVSHFDKHYKSVFGETPSQTRIRALQHRHDGSIG